MFSDIRLSADNYLEIDINVENVLKVKLDGDITNKTSEDKIEYVGTGIKITIITTPLEWRFQILTDTMKFNVSYVDFPEVTEVMAEIIATYMSRK